MSPDFYLPKYNIYIEHFGVIGTEGNYSVPWLPVSGEKKYIQEMYLKREEHKKNGTTLLETYSEYSKNGVLLKKLGEMLKEHGVVFRKPSEQEIRNYLRALIEKKKLERLFRFLRRYLSLYKSNGKEEGDLEDLRKFLITNFPEYKERTQAFFKIFVPLYKTYQSFLKNFTFINGNEHYSGMIDFDDMILKAKTMIEEGHIKKNYKYIIIDEFQDVSKVRMELIEAVQRQTNAHIFCVGDDWQSIYGFSGTDVSLFCDLKNYKELYLKNTHRNSQELIDIVGEFIQKNTKQKVKDLKSPKVNPHPIKASVYYSNSSESSKAYDDEINAIELNIQDIIDSNPNEEINIMLLGRNNKDRAFLNKNWQCVGEGKYKKSKKFENSNFPNVNIYFMTVHAAKGLEEDHVIILNMEDDILGFPNKVMDDYLLTPLLMKTDNYPLAEERRIFYVALTRGRKQCYLCIPNSNESVFCQEIKDNITIIGKTEEVKMVEQEGRTCPWCKKGILQRRYNKKTKEFFLGCSEYNQGKGCRYVTSYNK